MKDNRTTTDEILSADEQRVCDMLACLERVEAPANFGFRVKGRISSRRQSEAGRRWVPASAAVAAPLGLALAIGGYFVLTTSYSPGIVAEPQMAELRPAELPAVEQAAVPVAVETVLPQIRPEPTFVETLQTRGPAQPASPLPAVKRTTSIRPPANLGGGSTVETQRIGNEITPATISIQEVLQKMGVDATYSSRSWTVGSVRSGTSASRSGLKPGDVIESVNGRALDVNTSFDGRFAAGSVRVRRDGKVVQVDLH